LPFRSSLNLYAVNNPEDIPLVVDEKLVKFLRHNYVQSIGLAEGPWYQLAGSAYDRTTYGFSIATRPEQDDELIRTLNSAPNRESYRLLNRNCADFAKQIINFYYPKSIRRSIVADLGTMTPKQAAKSLMHSGKRYPEMQLTTFIIPQVPGLKPSKPVHGVIESIVLAKKYVTPLLLFHPFVIGTVEAAYWAGWRFNPAKGALIFDPNSWDLADPRNALALPLTSAQRRSYERELSNLQRESTEGEMPEWRQLQTDAEPQVDAAGRPFLMTQIEGHPILIGLSRGNALRLTAPPEFTQELLLTRLEHELKSGKPPRASQQGIESDWNLLERATEARQAALTATR
jgi:hypothetical protein